MVISVSLCMENEPTPYDVKRLPREQHEQLKTILQHVSFSAQHVYASPMVCKIYGSQKTSTTGGES